MVKFSVMALNLKAPCLYLDEILPGSTNAQQIAIPIHQKENDNLLHNSLLSATAISLVRCTAPLFSTALLNK